MNASTEGLDAAAHAEADHAAGSGAVHRTLTFAAAPASGDLAAGRKAPFVPIGDGSLQLFRPHGTLAGADEVAAAIAAFERDSSIVVIGADSVLDAALAEHGVPRLGADAPTPGSTVLVRLCIEAAFTPMETQHLHALLCADPGPVPRGMAWALTRALRKMPARASVAWQEAFDAEVAKVGEDTRPSLQERLGALLLPAANRDGFLAIDELTRRMNVLMTWARGRSESVPSLSEVALRATALLKLARLRGARSLSRGELTRLCEELEAPFVVGRCAELGLYGISEPGAIVGPAHTVIWWGFARDRAKQIPRLRLSKQESDALAVHGVAPPGLATIMEGEARRWRRPLDFATNQLILVCPRVDAVGDATHPHPLWDELIAAMPTTSHASALLSSRISLGGVAGRRTSIALRAVPQAFDAACAPTIELGTSESASALELLLGCSLAHALKHRGKLHARLSSGPSEVGPQLFGEVTHYLLSLVFANGGLTPDVAALRAETLFDAELPRIAELLLLSDHQAERASLRRAIADSARLIGALVHRLQPKRMRFEVPVEGDVGPANVVGRIDLLLESPHYVIDFKWGTSAYREKLRNGTAVQLAIYATLLGRESGAAYLGLRDQRLLATRNSALPFAHEPGRATIQDIVSGVIEAIEQRVGELRAGMVLAPGALRVESRTMLDAGVVRIPPPCEHCELQTLCGRGIRA